MRFRRSFIAAVLSVPALIGVVACGEVQEAQQQVGEVQEGLDSAGTCARAVGLMGFTPNFSNPEKAAADAQAKVEEIDKLANQTADQTLRENLEAVQSSLEQAAERSIAPQDIPGWLQKHVEQTGRVLQACGG